MIGLMGLEQKIELPLGHFTAERTVKGCDMGSNQFRTDIPRLAQLYTDGWLNLDDFLTARLPLVADQQRVCRDGTGRRHPHTHRLPRRRPVIKVGTLQTGHAHPDYIDTLGDYDAHFHHLLRDAR